VYFNVFDALETSGKPEARDILERVQRAMKADELNVDLAAELPVLSAEGQRLLHRTQITGAATGQLASITSHMVGEVILRQGDGEGLDALAAAQEKVARALAEVGPGAQVFFSWKVLKKG
jgi:hypothetical protein